MVTQISADHNLRLFIRGRVMLKNSRAYFLAVFVNFPCKIGQFELEVIAMGILGTRFCF